MTFAELERLILSIRKREKQRLQEKASFDYMLADLVGRSVSRIYNSNSKFPVIQDAYPTLFDNAELEEKRAQKKAELSALRFRQFADSYNKKFTEVQK